MKPKYNVHPSLVMKNHREKFDIHTLIQPIRLIRKDDLTEEEKKQIKSDRRGRKELSNEISAVLEESSTNKLQYNYDEGEEEEEDEETKKRTETLINDALTPKRKNKELNVH